MDYAKALTFVTDDPRWKEKIAIGTGVVIVSGMLSVVLIGVLGFLIVIGYCVRLLQNVRDGQQTPLPEWDDWGGDLGRGFKLAVVTLVWSLPALLLMLPIIFGGVMMGVGSDGNDLGPLAALGGLVMMMGYCLVFLYGLFVVVLTPGFNIWFARDEQIGSGLQFTAIWAWTRGHLGVVIMFTMAYMVASMLFSLVAGIVGIILCGIGMFVTIPLSMLVLYIYQYHLLGQIAYKDRTGQPYYVPAATMYSAPSPAPAAPVSPAPDAPSASASR